MDASQVEARLQPLLEELFDDGLDEPQREELTRILSESPAARDRYRKMLDVHTALEWTFAPQSLPLPEVDIAESMHCHLADPGQAAEAGATFAEVDAATPRPIVGETHATPPASVFTSAARFAESIHWRQHPGRFFAAASVLTLLFWLGFYNWFAPDSRSTAPNVARGLAVDVVASLTASQDCRWAKGAATPADPMRLTKGQRLTLEAGLLEITYQSGVRVVLEGPVTYIVSDRNAGQLDVGKLVAVVSQKALGFSVETPTATVSDLGTQFGLRVETNGLTEVHVFEGLVEVQVPLDEHKRQQYLVTADEALRFAPNETAPRRLASCPKAFTHQVLAPSTDTNPEHPEQIAVESFRYRPGRDTLRKSNGGYGWLGPWQGVNDIVALGFTYQQDATALCSAGGAFQTGKTLSDAFRTINVARVVPSALLSLEYENKIGAEGQEVWLSVLGQRVSDDGRWGGVSLFDASREVLFIGDRSFNDDTWALEGKIHGEANSRVNTSERALLVVRIEFGRGASEASERVSLYVNPPLASGLQSVTPDAVIDDAGHFVFDRVRIASDIPVMLWDELRIGTTADSVRPTCSPALDKHKSTPPH